jgi:hypothetical protein
VKPTKKCFFRGFWLILADGSSAVSCSGCNVNAMDSCDTILESGFGRAPSKEGPGSIVSKSLSEPIPSHKDLDKGSAPLYSKVVKFLEELSK